MNNYGYLRPGIAAFVLALLFPAFWIYQYSMATPSLFEIYYAKTLHFKKSDWVYLVIGILEIYFYVNLKRILQDRFSFQGADILLVLIICNSAVFYGGIFCLDLAASSLHTQLDIATQEFMTRVSSYIQSTCTFIYGLLDLLIAILLLRQIKQLPYLLKIFASTLLVLSIAELTFFYPGIIALFPISVIMLALYFLQEPDTLEVV